MPGCHKRQSLACSGQAIKEKYHRSHLDQGNGYGLCLDVHAREHALTAILEQSYLPAQGNSKEMGAFP